MNILQKISRRIIKQSFELSIIVIEHFSNMEPYYEKVNNLRDCSEGTLGKGIAECLDNYDLTLVPKYESHDLKHVLLDYQMTAEGEIRMQAFMLGNRNYTIPCIAILTFGAILLPDLWKTLYSDYKKGRNSIEISKWSIENYSDRNLIELKKELKKPEIEKQTIFDMRLMTMVGAFISIITGVFGMTYCLPFLFSSNIVDIVGAGFPFIGGAILTIGGLLVLSNLSEIKSAPIKE